MYNAQVQKIKNSYNENEISEIEQLKRLDRKAKRPATVFAYVFGVAAALLMGVGMCISMGVIGTENLFPLGVVVGVVGIIAAIANYFIYRKILARSKKRYAEEIVRRADTLLNK